MVYYYHKVRKEMYKKKVGKIMTKKTLKEYDVVTLGTVHKLLVSRKYFSILTDDTSEPKINYSAKLTLLGKMVGILILILLTFPLGIFILLTKESPFKLENYLDSSDAYESIYSDLKNHSSYKNSLMTAHRLNNLDLGNVTHDMNKKVFKVYRKNHKKIDGLDIRNAKKLIQNELRIKK